MKNCEESLIKASKPETFICRFGKLIMQNINLVLSKRMIYRIYVRLYFKNFARQARLRDKKISEICQDYLPKDISNIVISY